MCIATPFVQIVQMNPLSIVQTDKLEKNGKKVLIFFFRCGKIKMSSRESDKKSNEKRKKKMRLIQYAIVDKNTGKAHKVGASLTKAQVRLKELKEENPTKNLVIAHKWCSF